MSVTAVPIRPLARGSVIKLWIGLFVLALGAAALAWVGTAGFQVTTTSSGLRYRVIEEGTGPTITSADLAALRYKLMLDDGTVLQDSDESGQPFVTSTEGVFPGFAEGLQLMQEGGRYKLWVPPGLHYQQVPPGAPFTAEDTLVFEVEVLQVAPGMAAMQQLMGGPGGGGAGGAPEGAGAVPGGAQPSEAAPPGSAPGAGSEEPAGNGQ